MHHSQLPTEIIFHVGQYLDRRHHTRCALVSRSWLAVFNPLVWESVCIRAPNAKDPDPFTRGLLCGKTHWVRSLIFYTDPSSYTFLVAKGCWRLRSLSINSIGYNATDRHYWRMLKEIVNRNRETLQLLSLHNMKLAAGSTKYDDAKWSPLRSFAKHPRSVLTTLRLVYCELPEMQLGAFWDICEQLEVLELRQVYFEMKSVPKQQRKAVAKAAAEASPTGPYHTHLGSKHQVVLRDFPKLIELTLWESGPNSSLSQLERIIRRAPKLKTLTWKTRAFSWFPIRRFMYLFTALQGLRQVPVAPHQMQHCIPLEACLSPCWPDLKSLTMLNMGHGFAPEEYIVLLETTQQLQKLDLPISNFMGTAVFESLIRRHSHTLTEIHWRDVFYEEARKWTQELLSRCPMLTKVRSLVFNAQDIIEGGKNWVCCDRLEEFCLFIDMSPESYDPPRTSMTAEEKKGQCWAIYAQLARLRALKVLDLSYQKSRRDSRYGLFVQMETPPMSLTMGLGQLWTLTELQMMRFQGFQEMSREDIYWILQHWPELKSLDGGRMATSGSRFINRMNVWDCGLAQILNSNGIETPGGTYPENYLELHGGLNWSEREHKVEEMPVNGEQEEEEEEDMSALLELDIFS